MKIIECLSAPTKAISGRPDYEIKSAIAKLLYSFQCLVKIQGGQNESLRCGKKSDLFIDIATVQIIQVLKLKNLVSETQCLLTKTIDNYI